MMKHWRHLNEKSVTKLKQRQSPNQLQLVTLLMRNDYTLERKKRINYSKFKRKSTLCTKNQPSLQKLKSIPKATK